MDSKHLFDSFKPLSNQPNDYILKMSSQVCGNKIHPIIKVVTIYISNFYKALLEKTLPFPCRVALLHTWSLNRQE